MQLDPAFSSGESIPPRPQPQTPKAKFPLGQLVATSNAAARLLPEEVATALARHQSGDWGDLDDEDRQANELALVHNMRLFSAYLASDGTKFWIITEWDRSLTTVLLPEDY